MAVDKENNSMRKTEQILVQRPKVESPLWLSFALLFCTSLHLCSVRFTNGCIELSTFTELSAADILTHIKYAQF